MLAGWWSTRSHTCTVPSAIYLWCCWCWVISLVAPDVSSLVLFLSSLLLALNLALTKTSFSTCPGDIRCVMWCWLLGYSLFILFVVISGLIGYGGWELCCTPNPSLLLQSCWQKVTISSISATSVLCDDRFYTVCEVLSGPSRTLLSLFHGCGVGLTLCLYLCRYRVGVEEDSVHSQGSVCGRGQGVRGSHQHIL